MLFYQLMKRIIDIIFALLMGVLLLPLLILITLIILVRMGRPVIFCQDRPGYEGKIFRIYKFRTMKNPQGADHAVCCDHLRLTAFGRFLRATSLDELPELFNVLKGDMSLVGPRPLLVQYLDRYSSEQFRRHTVKPGITGWAQIHGRNAVGWDDKFALDLWYVDNRSLWLDIKILVLTVFKVFKREGINQPGQATVQEFRPAQGFMGEDDGRKI